MNTDGIADTASARNPGHGVFFRLLCSIRVVAAHRTPVPNRMGELIETQERPAVEGTQWQKVIDKAGVKSGQLHCFTS